MAGELTDAVIAQLSAAGGVNLTPASGVLPEKMTSHNFLLAGRALRADAVLTGALLRNDQQEVHLRLHLVSVNGGEVLWAETFKQPRVELPALLDSIARGGSSFEVDDEEISSVISLVEPREGFIFLPQPRAG